MLSADPNQPGTWRFSLLGFPIAVHWMFWLTAALLGGALRVDSPEKFQFLLIWVAVVFVSVLVHEFGHAYFQRKYGGRPRILLWGFGGLAISDGRFNRRQSIIVTLAGPLIQLVLAVPFVAWFLSFPHVKIEGITYFAGDNYHLYVFVRSMVVVNIFWAVLNLLPIQPLDGGKLLGHVMHDRKRELRAKIGMGAAIAAGLALSILQRGDIFPLLLFGYLAYMNYQMARPQWR